MQQDMPGERVLVRLFSVDVDFDFVFPEQKGLFTEAAFASGGALLVRPDQHIVGNLPLNVTAEEVKNTVLTELGW